MFKTSARRILGLVRRDRRRPSTSTNKLAGKRGEKREEQEVGIQKKTTTPRAQPRSSHITRVPTEIILLFRDYLPPADVAALALSCKSIRAALGGNLVLKFKTIRDRVSFLRRLDALYPGHLLCYQCGVFHCRRKVNTELFKRTECYRKNGTFGLAFYDLPFTRVQEVMKCFRYGLDRRDAFLGALGLHSIIVRNCCQKSFVDVYPSIQRANLILKVVVSASVDRSLPPAKTVQRVVQVLCSHHDSSAVSGLDCKPGNLVSLRCSHCLSEVHIQFELQSCCSALVEVFMSYNLGPGISPFDWEWARLFDTSPRIRPTLDKIPFSELRYIKKQN